jgi:hypothetical protein
VTALAPRSRRPRNGTTADGSFVADPARSELCLGALHPGPGPELPEGTQGLRQDGLALTDSTAAGLVEDLFCPH